MTSRVMEYENKSIKKEPKAKKKSIKERKLEKLAKKEAKKSEFSVSE